MPDDATPIGHMLPTAGIGPTPLDVLVHDVARLRRKVMDNALRPFGATGVQLWALAAMARGGADLMTQSELADYLDISRVAIGKIVDRMEKNGHVARVPDAVDRRIKRIALTQDGAAIVESLRGRAKLLNALVEGDLIDDNIEAAEVVLSKLRRRLIEIAHDGEADGLPCPAMIGEPVPIMPGLPL